MSCRRSSPPIPPTRSPSAPRTSARASRQLPWSSSRSASRTRTGNRFSPGRGVAHRGAECHYRHQSHGSSGTEGRLMPPRPSRKAQACRKAAGQDRPVLEPAPQVIGKLPSGRVTVARILGQGLQDYRLQVPRNRPVDLPQGPRILVGDVLQDILTVGSINCRPQCQQLIQCGTQAIDVGAVIDQPVLRQGLLGAHVAKRADDVSRPGQVRRARGAGQAKVGHPQMAAAVHQQVSRLDVAVDYPKAVSVFQRFGRLDAQLCRPAEMFPVQLRGVRKGRRGCRPYGWERNRSG